MSYYNATKEHPASHGNFTTNECLVFKNDPGSCILLPVEEGSALPLKLFFPECTTWVIDIFW